ncbi:glycosyltransferase family 4 protein [Acaricomes phytoseiuli]|uniref:glycosyltransferase family 4 protein n=1 Tax=Acaricomes phytoseiuli TaxID=291968 RepID=UPI00036B4677|nr:glycosyltransferase family 1 protein [Acaricomes phytoseiuli]MCW1249153.1 glycosyltransferase family 4 protein [Acaricomes phytoseiuli]
MKIIVDARFTRTDYHDGISRYGASLAGALAELADVTLLISDERQLALLPDLPWVKINSPLSPSELFVARKINRLNPDVVFCPLQTMGSAGRRYGLILTLHDLIYYQHPGPPGFLPWPVRALWRLYHLAYWPQRLLLNRADIVATISQTTRALMQKHLLTRRPIRIVGNAPQAGAAPRASAATTKSLVYMGSFMPYKNVESLIRGMAHLPGYTLHLLSRINPARRAALEQIIPETADIVFHEGVSDAEYEQLLREATALVTLSRAEGYGLPLVEAMTLGTPVIVADTPIFREVGGAAAGYVDAEDSEAFAAAVRELEDPAVWQERAEASLQQAAGYSWEKSAQELLAAAEEVRALRNKN